MTTRSHIELAENGVAARRAADTSPERCEDKRQMRVRACPSQYGNKRAKGLFVFIAAALLTTALTVYAQRKERTGGYVINLEGDWVLNGSSTLGPWSPLPDGGIIQLRRRKGSEYIQLGDKQGNVIQNINCDIDDCTRSFKLQTPETISGGSILFEAVMIVIGRSPRLFTVLLSKGGELKEAVVELADGRADLSNVFMNRRRGTYLLWFMPKRVGGADRRRPVGPVIVDWEPGRPALITVKGLSPGLYEADMLGEDGGKLEPGTEAWLLFTPPEIFEEASRDFAEATALTDSWDKRMSQSLKRQFLRAALGSIDVRLRPRGVTRGK